MDMSDDGRCLAQWLGVSHWVGSNLCYWLVTEHGNVIARTTVQHVVRNDYLDPNINDKIVAFNDALVARLDDTTRPERCETKQRLFRLRSAVGDDRQGPP